MSPAAAVSRSTRPGSTTGRTRTLAVATPVAAAMLLAAPAGAGTEGTDLPVDLELVLAVDVSGSVDAYEAQQQREGYLEALVAPEVIRAIRSNQHQRIAVTYVEWAGYEMQRTVVGWSLIGNEADAQAFVRRLEANPPVRAMWTSISGAIDYAMPLFDGNGYEGTRKVIDVSGDGSNNRGRPAAAARDDALARGIVINGLPIVNDRPQPFDMPTPMEIDLDRYYVENVIGGPGSFIITADSFEAFKQAILAKLVREIAGSDGPRVVRLAAR